MHQYHHITISTKHRQIHPYVIKSHFINTVRNCNMFQPLKGNLQRVKLINSSTFGQKNESPALKFQLVCSE